MPLGFGFDDQVIILLEAAGHISAKGDFRAGEQVLGLSLIHICAAR